MYGVLDVGTQEQETYQDKYGPPISYYPKGNQSYVWKNTTIRYLLTSWHFKKTKLNLFITYLRHQVEIHDSLIEMSWASPLNGPLESVMLPKILLQAGSFLMRFMTSQTQATIE